MRNFTAYAMPCTQEQFEKDLEPTLKRWGVKIEYCYNFGLYPYLINNANGEERIVSTALSERKNSEGRTVIPYNPAKFVDSLFPEKWCVRTSVEFVVFFKRNKNKNRWTDEVDFCEDAVNDDGYIYYSLDSRNDLDFSKTIPTDYTEVTLEELVYHYKQKKEEVMKYRFKTKEEFEATCEKNQFGEYKCGSSFFVEQMYHLFGEEYQGTPENLIEADRWNITKEMIVPVDYVYKAPKYKLTITRAQLKEIYDIACSRWKKKIREYGKRLDLVTDTITFTEKEVETMFEAAVNDQPKVLERIFGNPASLN